MPARRVLLTAAALALLSGCAKPRMQTTEAYVGGMIPRPDRVRVSYFAIDSDQVRLDQGVASRVQRTFSDQPADQGLLRVAHETQTALAARLVERLQAYGLPAEIGDGAAAPDKILLVQGQIGAINEGNRTRRLLIGLGAGKSSVTADAQLYYATSAAEPRFLTAFQGQADSGRMPGAAETMGAGAAAQSVGTSAVMTVGTHAAGESRRDTANAEASQLADALAVRIGTFAASQGWIPVSVVH